MGGMVWAKHFRWVREEGRGGSGRSTAKVFLLLSVFRWVRKGGEVADGGKGAKCDRGDGRR